MRLIPLKLPLRQWLRPKGIAITEACVIGLVSGLTAVLLKQGAGTLGGWRVYLSHVLPVWFILPAIACGGGLLAGLLVEYFAPEATGSGIPQVKVALAQAPKGLSLRVALVKIVSTILVIGSGLTLGRQGPTVQVGAALAGQFSRWVPTSPDHRRQLIAAGAAAGLAAGFNAPIAGVLFVIEELLQDFSDLTLGTAILASFIGAAVSRLLGGEGLTLNLMRDAASGASFSAQEIPIFILLGGLAGLLGGLFNRGIFLSFNLYRRVQLGLPGQIALAGLISGALAVLLPATFRDNAGLREYLITGEVSWQIAAIAFVTKFILTLVAYGANAPGGLFAPALVLGSALGFLVGAGAQFLQGFVGTLSPALVFAIDSPQTYALTGMGAFFSAVTRGPITAIVIVFEMTADFNLVLPLMIGSVVSYLVADRVMSGSIYTRLLERKGIHLTKTASAKDELWNRLTADDVMQQRVETLPSQMTLDSALQAFSRSHHRGFPVMEEDRLMGIVTQSDLANATKQSLSGNTPIAELMTPQPVTVAPTDSLSHVLYILDRYQVSRLPVTEGRRLVGIITRADIIHAESEQLSGRTTGFRPQLELSYVVYQTRAPAIGKGRLLLPLRNPKTAHALLCLGGAIARAHQYELECLQVIPVSRSRAPAETPVRIQGSRRLLQRAVRLGREWQIPIHTQVRVAHDVSRALLEAVKERHADLLLMGWRGYTTAPGRVFGSTADTLIHQAVCDVVLVKWAQKTADPPQPSHPPLMPSLPPLNRWLIPVSGGPNIQRAIQFLPAFVSLSDRPEVTLCQVIGPSDSKPDTQALDQDVAYLNQRLACPICRVMLPAHSVVDAVLELASQISCDVIVLGASREGLVQHAIKGNIPAAIAARSPCTVILVRGPL